MTVTVDIELTEEQAEALLAWKDTPYRGCNDYFRFPISGVQASLVGLKLLEHSVYPGINGYRISDLGKQVRAKLQETG